MCATNHALLINILFVYWQQAPLQTTTNVLICATMCATNHALLINILFVYW